LYIYWTTTTVLLYTSCFLFIYPAPVIFEQHKCINCMFSRFLVSHWNHIIFCDYVSTMWNSWNFTEWRHNMRGIMRMFGNACLAWEFYWVFLFNDLFNAATWKYYKYIVSRSEPKFLSMSEKGVFDTILARNFRKASHCNLILNPIQIFVYSERVHVYSV
jgi:hypothetical protein